MGLNQTKNLFASDTFSDDRFTIVWLDNILDDDENYLYAQQRLRSSSKIHRLKLFNDEKKLKNFIRTKSSELKLILIINEEFVPIVLPKIHSFRQISSIYIRLNQSNEKEDWRKQFLKVKCTDENIRILIDAILLYSIHHRNRIDEPLNICLIDPNESQGKSTTNLNGNFLHSQVSLDVLLRMKSTSTEKEEFIRICRKEYQDNDDELKIIDEFERTYIADRALWWYTRESFLYRSLNKALRTQNMDMLFYFRFFIRDIEQELRRYQYKSTIRLYRGQRISRDELELLKKSIGQLISVNSFLSTSFNRDEALSFLPDDNEDKNLHNVLFQIDANPHHNGIQPFADITEQSYFPDENEVLFMCGAIFQLIRFNEKDHLILIQLRLAGENDHNLRRTCEHMKNEYGENTQETDLLAFGRALTKMGRYDEAEKYFRRLLNELPSNHQGLADCYHNLGEIDMERADYQSSLNHHEKALNLRRKNLQSNHPDLGESYNSLGIVHRKRADYRSALEYFEKALTIFETTFDRDDSKIGMCWNNLGNVYHAEKKYSLALDYYLKALKIQEKDLPIHHPDLGTLHSNIGSAYQCLNKSDEALKHFQLSLNILEKTLPSEHPAIATILKNIGVIYENKDNFHQARHYFERAAVIRRSALSLTHPDRIRIEEDLQRVRSQIK